MTILRVFLPFAFGYLLSYIFRAVNAVIAPNLVGEFGLDAGGLGLLTSTYFLAFAAAQLPLGMLLDRFGPRRTEAALLLVAAAGTFVFAVAPNTGTLILGRALIGIGVSACLMAAFKAFVLWFPVERLPLINGLEMAVGGIGALAATVPVEASLAIIGWRGVFVALGVFTLVCAAVLFAVVPERQEVEHQHLTLREQVGGVVHVMTSPLFWRVVPATFSVQAAFLAAQSLWAGPWLRDVAGFDRDQVASGLLIVAGAMTVGFVFAGALAERMGRLGIRPVAVALFTMSISMAVQALLVFGAPVPPLILWSLYALFGTSGILVYAGLSQVFPIHLVGRVNAGINLLVFTASFVFQWGVGLVIDRWPPSASGGYLPEAYQAGFGAVLAIQVIAMLWLALYRKAPLPLKG